MHVHEAVVAHHITGKLALDLHPDDVFWCTADPGWVTGTSYGIIAPLTNGVTSIVDEAEFDAERWYGILQDQKVTVWYTAPTAIRMLMKAGAEIARKYDLGALRFLASVGEPLNPEAVVWGAKAFGRPFHDNWWQTETGGIMIANYAAMDVRPGSMGRPLPGIDAAIVRRVGDDRVEVIEEPDVQGELALRPGWPSMFRGYWDEPERYRKCFAGGWYLTGDLARRDRDGYFWFVGREDDVIKTSGHLIGPFEVESVLMEHPAVAEAGVIGKPDPVALEVVKAFVSLKDGLRAERRAAAGAAGLRAHAAGRGRGARRRSSSSRACPRPAAGRSCGACSRRASWDCPRATPRRWRSDGRGPMTASPAALDRRTPSRCCARCCSSGASRRRRPSSTAWARSAASCTSTSARRRWRSGRCRRSRRRTPSSPPTASTATRWRAGSRPASLMAEMYGKANGCSRGRGGSMHLFDVARRFYGGHAIVGGGLPVAVGLALADTLQASTARSRPASSATARWPRASSTSR